MSQTERSARSEPGTDTKYCSECGNEISTKAAICPDCGVSQDGAGGSSNEPSGRYMAAFIGSVVSFFFGWFPFLGPIAGGVVAGYFRGTDKKESVISAVIGTVLASVLFLAFAVFGLFAQAVEGTPETFIGWVILCVGALVYFYGFGALGGYLGAAISDRDSP